MTGRTNRSIAPRRALLALIPLAVVSLIAWPTAADASHSWGGYHWARQANPFTLQLGDNVAPAWDPILVTTSGDWSTPSNPTWPDVLDTTIVGGLANPKNCRATAGRVEVCNSKYGNNGWLGIAQIWITGGTHITQGVVKLNDTYFNTTKYNTTEWRNLVSCQEVGHTLGLGHQDEDFNNLPLGTCMDYTSDPTPTANQHPNKHDYDQLALIYAHTTDTTNTATSSAASRADVRGQSEWGHAVAQSSDHRTTVYERDFGSGAKVVTFVIWA